MKNIQHKNFIGNKYLIVTQESITKRVNLYLTAIMTYCLTFYIQIVLNIWKFSFATNYFNTWIVNRPIIRIQV